MIGFETKTSSEKGTLREPLGALVRPAAKPILLWCGIQAIPWMLKKHLDVVNQALFSSFFDGRLQWLSSVDGGSNGPDRGTRAYGCFSHCP